ncbi:hypothetical protein Tco_0053902 [Tanacetum coccineum]
MDEEEIERIIEGEEDEKLYASTFVDYVFNDDVDDTSSKIEPESHKEKSENIDDDDDNELLVQQKKYEEVVKEKVVVEIKKETNVDDNSDKLHGEVVKEKEVDMSGSQEIRKEQKQTPIPSPIRSPRNVSSSDKTISEELLLMFTKTNEIIKKEMPRLVKLAVDKDREISRVDISGMVSKEFEARGPKMIEELFHQHMQNTTLNIYPKPSSLTVNTSSADLQ